MNNEGSGEKIINKYARGENDTGSSEFQVAALTGRIKELTQHLRIHKKDHSSMRGLLALVARRRKLLKYLSRKNRSRYELLAEELKIRH